MPDRKSASKSLPSLAVELKDLVVAYAKQETVEPLKNLRRFVAFGFAGSVLVAVGLLLLVLAVLRALQTEAADTFDGDWSFAPYLLTVVICMVVSLLARRAIGAAKRRARRS
ncbi:MAG TPA: hypothetical protein VFV35_08200 [Acidimicrobiales bacterium]|nr:hypothetical protein [Acidimicrobiales bacterium]